MISSDLDQDSTNDKELLMYKVKENISVGVFVRLLYQTSVYSDTH